MLQIKVLEKIKTHILCSVPFFFFFFRKSCRLRDNVDKYCRAGQATDDRQYGACTLHAGVLWLQTHTQNKNTYCFSTATMVARTHLNVTLNVYCLCCIKLTLHHLQVEGNSLKNRSS